MKTKRMALAVALTLVIFSLGLTSAFNVSSSAQENQAPDTVQKIEGSAALGITPERYRPVYTTTPPDVTPKQMDSFAKMEERMERADESMIDPTPNHPVAPPDKNTQTMAGDGPLADNSFTLFQNNDVTLSSGGSSTINEPAHAANGKYVFYTGNWYVAKSTNGGAAFTYLNPYTDFSDFCCDQDVVQDSARNLLIWFRQGNSDASGVNRIKLGVSTNGGVSFAVYTFTPANIDSTLTSNWFDYPHLATTNNYLYITTNVFNANDQNTGKYLIKISLTELAAAATIHPVFWKETSGFTWTPVQGARETMYLGSQVSSAGGFKVYSQPESSNTLTSVTKTVPAWTSTNSDGHCAAPNGRNPCGRADSRINAGWVAKGVIGFFWNVKEGGGFAYPYINAATFNESTKAYLARPYIWNGSFAFQYGAAAPNARGDLGIACLTMGGTQGYPKLLVGIDDSYNGTPPAWELSTAASSTTWGLTNSGKEGAGDYLRVRAHNPADTIWTASGYTATGSPVKYKGRYVVFGRERETRSWNRWKLL
jgi:hypothetical protein